jgi:single-stranded-DNA-specific exonuclease
MHHVIDEIIKNRGITNTQVFLNPSANDLHDPWLLNDMQEAVDILKIAIALQWFVTFYGDYDNDGINATATAMDLFRKAGGQCGFFINPRSMGYGMQPQGIDALLAKYPETKVVVTVDNGIVAFEGAAYAKSMGLKVIITDHHEAENQLPIADAVIDPKRKDSTYPFEGLCGAAVAWKVMFALYKDIGLHTRPLHDALDMVAFATVGDVVPLLNENRYLVKEGLVHIRNGKRLAFATLNELTEAKEVNAHYTLAFVYVPTFNALGRMLGEVDVAVEALLSDDDVFVRDTITFLIALNQERKAITMVQTENAEHMVASSYIEEAIVLASSEFTPGIIGLIAGRLKETFYRPVIVFAEAEDGILKGSARSIDGFPLKTAFEHPSIEQLIIQGGGHAKAGGLSIKKDKLDEFTAAIKALAKDWLKPSDLVRPDSVDAIIHESDITPSLLDELQLLEPFGEGFPRPHFLLRAFRPKKVYYMGAAKNHLKLAGNSFDVIAWNEAEAYRKKGPLTMLDIKGYPGINEWNGRRNIQFVADPTAS